MKAIMKKWKPTAIALSVASALVVMGCGGDDSGLASRYSVTGNVTYKGAPVAKGGITFEPTKPPLPEGRFASGTIENGYYSLTTSIKNDGAFPGEYKVVIVSSSVDMTDLAKKSGGLIHQGDADFQKVVKDSKSLVPVKYTKGETTKLTATVKAQSNKIDFDLTDD
jgi:major membrane immunogen (membrane-anchored lipoprotein)